MELVKIGQRRKEESENKAKKLVSKREIPRNLSTVKSKTKVDKKP